MSARETGPWRVAGPLVGLVTAAAATASWSDLVVDPRGFVVPTVLAGLVVVLTGVGLRRLDRPAPVTALGQLLVGALAWHAAVGSGAGPLGVVPTRGSVLALVAEVERGAVALATYLSPVEVQTAGTHALLAGCGLLVVWSVDVLAHTVRQPPLAGLPLLVALSVPTTVLLGGLDRRLLVVVAVGYLLLLASDRHDRWRGATPAESSGPAADPVRSRLAGIGTAVQVAGVAVLAALVLAPLVPVSDPLRPGGDGSGSGDGGSEVRLNTVNPFVTLQRDLLRQTDTPMLYARTDAADPRYLRTTVLDEFDDDSWSASTRDLPAANSADGNFPSPPGISAGTGGVVSEWVLQLAPRYRTAWLPLPYPVRSVEVEGAWRYDERALDVALAFGEAVPELRYGATGFEPAVTASSLDRALAPPDEILEPMTEVPRDLPAVVAQRAREVTQRADTPYRKAVALQDWFREDGDFTYSLEGRPGSGLELLADFVTDDRVGYCEQFAAAMAAMGRTLGIPSRVAVGFLGPEEQTDGTLLYTSDARHAWTEMYFQGAGWVRFEPTPAQRTGESPDYTRESLQQPETSPTPSDAPELPEQLPEDRLPDDAAGEDGSVVGGRLLPALAVLVLLGAALAAPTLVRRRQRRRRLAASDPGPRAEGAWAELRSVVLDAGLPWDDARSPRAQARALVTTVTDPPREDVELLEQLLQQVERHRYARATGPGSTGGGVAVATRPGTAVDVEQVLERWERLVHDHVASRGPRLVTRLRRRVLPGSLLRRTS